MFRAQVRRRSTGPTGVVMGWLLFAIAVGALIMGPSGALVAGLLFVGAVFGIKGIRG